MIQGTCPVCNGSGHMPCPDHLLKNASKNGWYGYRSEDNTIDCTNCGSQYMYGRSTGQVNLRGDGTPCKHEYESTNIGRCLTRYKCIHCSDQYTIDSGD